jgi:hypothetical protein
MTWSADTVAVQDHLEDALDAADDRDARFHVRQALQYLEGAADGGDGREQ